MSDRFALSGLVNLELYPVDKPGSPEWTSLVMSCRERMRETGALELPNFLTEEGLRVVIDESVTLEPSAFHSFVEGNPYLSPLDETQPERHPLRNVEPTSLGAVAYDQFPLRSAIRSLYEWDELTKFIGGVVEVESIYRYADPMGGLNLSVMKHGDYLRWHFDQTDFVVSLAVRSADKGGYFEFVPMIRRDGDENYEGVRRLLDGDPKGVVTIPTAPGSLILFRGRHSIHRVSPIEGKTSRLILLFGYDTKPETYSSDHLRKMRYGRTTPFSPQV